MNFYAVSYLDSNGNVESYGYATSDGKPGDIITSWSGKRVRLDFVLPDSAVRETFTLKGEKA